MLLFTDASCLLNISLFLVFASNVRDILGGRQWLDWECAAFIVRAMGSEDGSVVAGVLTMMNQRSTPIAYWLRFKGFFFKAVCIAESMGNSIDYKYIFLMCNIFFFNCVSAAVNLFKSQIK